MTGDPPTGVVGGSPRALLETYLTLAAAIAFAATLLWGLTDAGYFWPRWVWFALGFPAAFGIAVRRTQRIPNRGDRWFARVTAILGLLSAMVILVWWFAHPGPHFWPIWPLVVFGAIFVVYGVVTGRLSPRGQRHLTRRVEELTRTRRGALDVQAAELRRIERDLHDGAQARLVALSMKLGRAEDRLDDHPELAELVREARLDAAGAIAELRDLARGIAPPVLADRGLAAAVEALGSRSPMEVTVSAELERRLPPVVETAAYFVAAESLTNVAKHASGAAAQVSLSERDGLLVVEVSDEGEGGADGSGGAGGSGLAGLRRRVEALDGVLTVISEAGHGTVVRAELPCSES